MEHLFSERTRHINSSAIRELLKLTEEPDIISFAGGLPAPELFPIEEMKEVSHIVLTEMGEKALQYSATEGYKPLRKQIAQRMAKQGVEKDFSQVLITSGSQQGLDFTGKIFINPGDFVVCESPSYLGAINAFKAYECQFIEVSTDDYGMDMSELESLLHSTEGIKFIYVIPDFQNPTGRTWSEERRRQLVELANKFKVIIIEDNPYGELRFEGNKIPAIQSFDTRGCVVYLGTFSKTFSPGMRIGWVCADETILNKYILIKQGADLQSSSISQIELSTYLDNYDLDEHIEVIKKVYKKRRDVMYDMMMRTFPQSVSFKKTEGGLFTWVELPAFIDAQVLLKMALERQVAFVPGESFFPNGGHQNTMRLNFSNMSEFKIEEGIKRLGELITEVLDTENIEQLCGLIDGYTPTHVEDEAAKNRILSYLKLAKSPLGKTDKGGHITASSWIVDADQNKYLLTHHKKLERWLQLGGHTECGESIYESALREAREESGLTDLQFLDRTIFDLDVHLIPARKDEPAHYHYDIRFLMQAKGEKNILISDESNDLKWIKSDDLRSYSDESSLLRMAEKFEIKYKEKDIV